jgi:putative transposase
MPGRYEPDKKHSFSGKRIKRGLYRSQNGTLLNADTNGAYNILRKTDPKFSFSTLVAKVGTKINEWLHPVKRIQFLKKKTHKLKKPVGLILPSGQLELF